VRGRVLETLSRVGVVGFVDVEYEAVELGDVDFDVEDR